jgi:hypothetical protein
MNGVVQRGSANKWFCLDMVTLKQPRRIANNVAQIHTFVHPGKQPMQGVKRDIMMHRIHFISSSK